jgi:anti-sigma regulatory factor (Ser/Thr protein kinase)
VEDLVTAVSETVVNAICHGRSPVGLRLWVARDRIVVTVTDQGSGPSDPFAGLLPAATALDGGLGLWLTHQLCSLVTFDHRDSFTIRLIAGNPHPGC